MKMNWKFWRRNRDLKIKLEQAYEECNQVNFTLTRKIQELHGQSERAEKRAEEAERQHGLAQELNVGLGKENYELRRRLEGVYQRTPALVTEAQQRRGNMERLLALGGVAEDHPVWRMVLSYVDEHERNERLTALGPDLGDAARQYNAGRAGSAFDLASALRDLHYQAQIEARKLKDQ